MYHTKKIALFISHIYGDYQKNVCQGVVDSAMEYGFQTEIYTTSDGEALGKYGLGETSIMRIPNFDDFSGIVMASGTYPDQELKDKIIELLKEKSRCPIIEIGEYNTPFPSISLENNLTAGTLTEHLISVHNYRRICYLGCSTETFFSDQRENAYRNVMMNHSLTVGARDVFLCAYDEGEVDAALDGMLTDGKPDAVVCYNDKMALLFMVAAARRGYRIPEDFAVTGCDMLPEGQNATPPLTTVTFPAYQVGEKAMEQLMRRMRGEDVAVRTSVFAETVIGGSCGCSYQAQKNPILYEHELLDRIQDLEGSIFISMRMSADFSHVTDIDEGMDVLEQYVPKISGCTEFYLCLYADWDSLPEHILTLTGAENRAEEKDTLLLKLAVKNGKRLPECSFPKKTLLPEYINRDSSPVHIVCPLFFEEREFGYIVLAFAEHQVNYHFQFVHWIMNITQLLQNLCEAKSAALMQSKLETIFMTDPLTGLLNRHGYEYQLPRFLAGTTKRQSVTAFLFDMDCLKFVNDEFGHTEGDFALKAIGGSILRATEDLPDTLCVRFGGDEFYVLSNHYDAESAQDLIDHIDKYLKNYNSLSGKPYLLSVSGGFATMPYRADFGETDIQELIAAADRNMYQLKKSKDKQVLRDGE